MVLVAVVFVVKRPRAAAPLPVIAEVGSFQLTNQFGIRVRAEDLAGYVWVADVIFTRCPGQCHQLSQMLREVQKRVPAGAPVRFVSLTANPEHDTPELLAKYASRYGADGATWNFLTGPKVDVYRFAIEGLKFSVVENPSARPGNLEDQFIHSASFAVVDRRGRLRSMVQMEDPDAMARLMREIELLSREDWK